MTRGRRIFLNVLATNGRSVFTLVCGLFTARWALQALGPVDYGLYGLVGSLSLVISFFNAALSGSVCRFYAVALGEPETPEARSTRLEECRKWFNTAFAIYTVVPFVFAAVCVPMGLWAVGNWLAIPPERTASCNAVLLLTAVTAIATMACAPFHAMYIAKQRIAELTLYSFVQTVLNVVVVHYMFTHPRDWLSRYAAYRCLLATVPLAIIAWRAAIIFPECRVVLGHLADGVRIRKIFSYALWQLFGTGGAFCRYQFMQVVINKFFGPRANATMTVANTVNGYAGTFTAEMAGAFAPAVCAAYGEGAEARMRTMGLRVSKFGLLITLAIMLPLALELPEVLRLWLGTPPEHLTALTALAMATTLLGQSVLGQDIVVNAMGRVAHYQAFSGLALMSALPFVWLLSVAGHPFAMAVGGGLLVSMAVSVTVRVLVARAIAGMGIRQWLASAILPVAAISIPAAAAGWMARLWLTGASPVRVVATTLLSEAVFLPLAWFAVLDATERRAAHAAIAAHFGRRRYAPDVGRPEAVGGDGEGVRWTGRQGPDERDP